MGEQTSSEKVVELHDQFMVQSAEYKLGNQERRNELIPYINAILDAYLDMWPELCYEPSPH